MPIFFIHESRVQLTTIFQFEGGSCQLIAKISLIIHYIESVLFSPYFLKCKLGIDVVEEWKMNSNNNSNSDTLFSLLWSVKLANFFSNLRCIVKIFFRECIWLVQSFNMQNVIKRNLLRHDFFATREVLKLKYVEGKVRWSKAVAGEVMNSHENFILYGYILPKSIFLILRVS